MSQNYVLNKGNFFKKISWMILNEMLNANTLDIYSLKFKHNLNKIIDDYQQYLLD